MGPSWALLSLFAVGVSAASSEDSLHSKCKDLLRCTISKGCAQLSWLTQRFTNAPISAQLYDDLDHAIDYGCIFTSGCLNECNRCPLCASSKQQLVDVLTGEHKGNSEECSTLINCASDCVLAAGANATHIQWCLRQSCAPHCFDGSCTRCSAFITRVFNQGQCYEMFRDIVAAKFSKQFTALGRAPSIG